MKRGLAYAQTLKGDVCRPFASDGVVAISVGDKISLWYDPEDARTLGRDLLRIADEAERIAFDGVKLADGVEPAPKDPQPPRHSRVLRRATGPTR